MAELKIELCGRLADNVGRHVSVACPEAGLAVEQIFASLVAEYPPLAQPLASGRIKACVNDVIVSPDHLVRPQDLVALFPPVSGG